MSILFLSALAFFILMILLKIIKYYGVSLFKKPVQLSQEESELANRIGFNKEIVSIVKGTDYKGKIEQLKMYSLIEEGRVETKGLSITIPQNSVDLDLDYLTPRLLPKGYYPFISEIGEEKGIIKIGVIKAEDQYDLINLAETNGDNYRLSNADIIKNLKEWEKKYSVKVTGAGMDWLMVLFRIPGEDVQSFADELLKFCPDLVDREEIISTLKIPGEGIYFWWD